LPADDPRQRQPDIALARKLLGWEPKVDLAQGLARTLAYYQALLGGESPRSASASAESVAPIRPLQVQLSGA
jgi:UDP-glucuronate decarboxylase